MDFLQWTERLGALGILALAMFIGLRWGARRIDRLLDQNERLIKDFKDAVDTFKQFEHEERETHGLLHQNDRELKALVTEVKSMVQDLTQGPRP